MSAEFQKTWDDHARANVIYSRICEALYGEDLKHAKMAVGKITFNLFCMEEDMEKTREPLPGNPKEES